MKFDVISSNLFSIADSKQFIEAIHLPALLLDNDFKIVAKNEKCFDSRLFRIGSRFDRLLKKGDSEKLGFLDEGKIAIVGVQGEASQGYATVIRGLDCYLVCFRYIANGLYDRITERFASLSGYDVGVNACMLAAMEDLGNTDHGKRLALVIERLLLKLSEVHRLSFFDFSATVSSLFFVLGEVEPKMLCRINLPKVLPETIAVGNGDDLLLMLSYVLLLCFDSAEERIEFIANDCGDGISFEFSCRAREDKSDIAGFVNAFCDRAPFKAPLERPAFWAFFSKLLADTNLWDISAQSKNGDFSFKVFVPSVARGEEFYLRDVDTFALRTLLEYFFRK